MTTNLPLKVTDFGTNRKRIIPTYILSRTFSELWRHIGQIIAFVYLTSSFEVNPWILY